MDVSIIICTRDRAAILQQTLRAFQRTVIPAGWEVEMIIADNGSTDRTADVVREARHARMKIHHVWEPRPGKSRAQNTALAAAQGTVLLFTDDDVEPAHNWIEAMARPMLEGHCDAVAGRILLARELQRPWLSGLHAMWLAQVEEPAEDSPELVGASMGIHRAVFSRLDLFDEELGPGASGFGEETLLWLQMLEAGMRIRAVRSTYVIHRPDPARFLRSNWLLAAAKRGRTDAYLMHHWEHRRVWWPSLHAKWIRTKWFLRQLGRPLPEADSEGCPGWEMSYVARIERLECYARERLRPRRYERRALRRKSSPGGSGPVPTQMRNREVTI